MNKTAIIVVVLVIIAAAAGFYFMGSKTAPTGEENHELATGAHPVTPGQYQVDPARSEFKWAGKKPLIDGYINSGTIGIKEGTITVGEGTAQGSFTLDINTLRVGLTAKKPGQEGALEGTLKSERFFNAAQYPTATFAITSVAPLDESQNRYTVTGNLTLKGTTHEISFPASIYLEGDELVASAETEIDRTKWGITFGSSNFFENLGDNAISDMVAISFRIVAPMTAQ